MNKIRKFLFGGYSDIKRIFSVFLAFVIAFSLAVNVFAVGNIQKTATLENGSMLSSSGSPDLDYSNKTVGVLTPANKPSYYSGLISALENGLNANIKEIPWNNISTALDANSVETVVIPDSSNVPYGTIGAVKSYLSEGGKLLSLGGVPFENAYHLSGGNWLSADEYLQSATNDKERYTLSAFNSSSELSSWGRNASGSEGSRTVEIGSYGSPTGTNALHVKLSNYQAWDMIYRSVSKRGYSSVGLWAKGSDKTNEISVEIRETDGARWYTSISVTDEWKYYVLGPKDFKYWPWDTGATNRGGEGDALNMQAAESIWIGISGSFSSVPSGQHEYWLDDIAFLNYEKPVEEELVLEGLSPEWKYYPITNGNSVVTYDNQVFVADRSYVLPDDAVSLNSGTQGAGFEMGKKTRFVPLIEIYDSKNLLSGCLAWMNINSCYSADRASNGSITACFGTNDPDFYNSNGLAAVLDVVRTMLNDSLFTEAGANEYVYVESETSAINLGAYVRGENLSGVTAEIVLLKNGSQLRKYSYNISSASTVKQFADTYLKKSSVTHQLSSGKPDSVIVTLKKNGTMVDRIAQEISYWSPKPLSERKYITVKDGEYYQDGKPLRIYGINFMPNLTAIGFDAKNDAPYYHEQWWNRDSYDSDKIYKQLLRLKEVGFNAVSINCYIQEAEAGKNLIHFVDMCDKLGIYVDCFLAGADGVTTGGGAAVRIIELQHLDCFDNIIAYDLTWERTLGYYESSYSNANGRKVLDEKWINWVIKNYGSVAAAESLWGESMPTVNGEYAGPTDAMLTNNAASALVAAYRRFADEYLGTTYGAIIDLLKTKDQYHLFSSRAGAPSGTAMYSPANMVFDAQGVASVYDFYSPEFYDEGQGFDRRDHDFVNIYAQYAMPDSPVVWKEFGERVWEGSNFLSPTEHIKYSNALQRQANDAEAMLKSAISTHATAIYYWCFQPGYRAGEESDCGVINPDGSDRPVTKIFRQYKDSFMNQPTRGEADVTFTVDRDLSATGWKAMYQSIKTELLKAVDEGKTVALVDAGTGTTTANVSDKAIGGVGTASATNPARYVNGEFRKVEVKGADGIWIQVNDGDYVKLPSGGAVDIRVTMQNTQRSQWLSSGNGAVNLVSCGNSDFSLKGYLSENVEYLERLTQEFRLTDNYNGKQSEFSMRYEIEGRFPFGTPFTFNILSDDGFDTQLDFYNNYSASVGAAVEKGSDVFQSYQTGLVGAGSEQSYIIYKVERNSPIRAEFKDQTLNGEYPEFYTSADGINWSPLAMESYIPSAQQKYFSTQGIGEENKYIKIVIPNTPITEVWRLDLRRLYFNSSKEQSPTPNTTYDFVKNYNGAVSAAFDKSADICQVYKGGLSGNNTPNTYVVYEVAENSPISVKIKVFADSTSGRPEFYASPDGVSWTKLNMQTDRAVTGQSVINYYRDCIGVGNKYIKIKISNVALGSSIWYCDLQSISFLTMPETDTTQDFVNGYSGAVANAFEINSVANSEKGGLIGSGDEAYIVYKVEKNSPFIARYVLNSASDKKPQLFASADGFEWIAISAESIYSGDVTSDYTYGIGGENKYIKLVLSGAEARLQSISYNKNTEPKAETDTNLNFLTDYNNSVSKACEVSGTRHISAQNGLVSENYPNAYAVYKVENNSPIKAEFKIFRYLTDGRPEFYVSTDGLSWQKIAMEETVNGDYTEYYRDSIGADKQYVKILLCNTKTGYWHCDLQTLSYNASVEMVTSFDNTLDFVNAFNSAVSKATDKSADVCQVWEGGLSGNNTPNTYIVYEVEDNSPIAAKFKLFPANTSGRPEFYASADGLSWTKLNMYTDQPITTQGTYTYYNNAIGRGNKYVKIVISNAALGAYIWYCDLQSFSYNLVDPSGDGKVNALDLAAIRKMLLGGAHTGSFDINRDGFEDIKDLVYLKKYLSGLYK